jgi:hypothetical protein
MMSYLLGGLLGLGILLVYYGFRRVNAKERTHQQRIVGLVLINIGVLSIAGSLALSIWGK